MRIKLFLQACTTNTTTLSVNESVVTINSVDYDLSTLPIDSEVEASSPAIGKITNVSGELSLSILFQYNVDEFTLINSEYTYQLDDLVGVFDSSVILQEKEVKEDV